MIERSIAISFVQVGAIASESEPHEGTPFVYCRNVSRCARKSCRNEIRVNRLSVISLRIKNGGNENGELRPDYRKNLHGPTSCISGRREVCQGVSEVYPPKGRRMTAMGLY